MELEQYQRKSLAAGAARRAAKAAYAGAKTEYIAAADDVTHAEAARVIIQEVAATIQAQAHARIAAVVGRCLTAVFDEPYQLDITFTQKRGRTEAELLFRRGPLAVDPMGASGGGAVDVAAFALRLAALMLARPPKRRLLVMDEPMKFLSVNLRPRMAALLVALSEEMGVQFIIVTHDEALIPEGAVRIEL